MTGSKCGFVLNFQQKMAKTKLTFIMQNGMSLNITKFLLIIIIAHLTFNLLRLILSELLNHLVVGIGRHK